MYIYVFIYIYMCVCCVCVCVSGFVEVCMLFLYLCARAPQSQAYIQSSSRKHFPLGTMGKTAGAKANKATKATGCKRGRKVADSSAVMTIAAMAVPFRNLMNYRQSEKCVKAANYA